MINAVIFDWGGVLIDNPAPLLSRYCADALGVSEPEYRRAHLKHEPEFITGRTTEQQFWNNMCTELGVGNQQIGPLWARAFADSYRPRREMLRLVTQLKKKGYKTAILSNTEKPSTEFFRAQNYDMFDVKVFSCEAGVAKPKRRIYEIALGRLSTHAQQTVFVDDKKQFTDAAEQIGMNTILFTTPGQLKNELTRLDVKTD